MASADNAPIFTALLRPCQFDVVCFELSLRRDLPVVCMIHFIHSEVTINHDTLAILLDDDLFLPIGVLISYTATC